MNSEKVISKNRQALTVLVDFLGAGEGFEPPTSGLSLRAGRRRVSQTFACSALFARTLGDTALKNNSPDCF